MSYLDNIEELFKQKGIWDYYGCHYQKILCEVFRNPKIFINETFMSGHKYKLFDSNINTSAISSARAAHSISSFFMGFVLANGLIPSSLENFCTVEEEIFDFSYVWYLTSLYHDFGYFYERDTTLANQLYDRMSNKRKSDTNTYYHGVLYQLRRDKQISLDHSIWRVQYFPSLHNAKKDSERSPLQRIQEYVKCNYHNLLCKDHTVRMPMRSSRTVNNYLKYRLLSDGNHRLIDHGICGGMLFYDRIIKNYLAEYESEKRCNPNVDLNEFFKYSDTRNLRFSLRQLIVFMYVADCIINHNIWKATPKNEDLYQEYKLDSLIGDKFEKVNFCRNPLLFILVMSDTLEPYKNFYAASHQGASIDNVAYNSFDVFTAYQNFDISFSSNTIRIRVPEDLRDTCRAKLQSMEDWIDIRIAEEGHDFLIVVL